jgi:hypothetical protein
MSRNSIIMYLHKVLDLDQVVVYYYYYYYYYYLFDCIWALARWQ